MKNLIFDTKKGLIEYLIEIGLRKMKNGDFFEPLNVYYLRHGEYAQPDYRPIYYRSLGGWVAKAQYYFYPGTCNAPLDGPCNIWINEDTGFDIFPIEKGVHK